MRLIARSALQVILRKQCGPMYCRTLSNFSHQDKKQSSKEKNNENLPGKSTLLGLAATGLLGYYFLAYRKQDRRVFAAQKDECKPPESRTRVGAWRSGYPTYSSREVSNHATKETRIWVSFREGVYDITDYVVEHPGGEQILLAAGGHLELLFRMYPFHQMDPVLQRLEKLRIGNLRKQDQVDINDYDDPYVMDPVRHCDTEPVIKRPYCGGVKLSLLANKFITPNEYFYVRNHLPVPRIDVNNYELAVEVEGKDEHKKFTLDDVKKLPQVTITCTLMCTGNRRSEMMQVTGDFKAVNWGPNGMSNARWTGARLRDVLEKVCINEGEEKYKHVQFEGVDVEANGTPYGASIPIWKALDKYGDVILAYEMNGVPLPPEHGYPLRVIIPGHIGARSVKWLSKIIVSCNESPCHYQQIDYKSFSPSTTWKTADYSKSPAVQQAPVTSAICSPIEGERVKVRDGFIRVKGYAYSGAGQKIIRVDVTTDGGDTWREAHIDHQDDSLPPRHWSWSLWSIELPVDPEQREVEIWCKAVDSSNNSQPETFKNIYNFKGCVNHAYHRVKVKLI